MDQIEVEFISKITDDYKNGKNLDDKYFVNLLNASPSKIRCCLELIKTKDIASIEQHFSIGICSLQVFVLANWFYIKQLNLDNDLLDQLKEVDQDDLKNELNLDNSDYQPIIKYPELLYLSKMIIKNCPNNVCYLIWKLRYLIVYQSLMNRSDNSFQENLQSIIIEKLNELDNKKLRMRFLLEICQFNLLQNRVQDLRELLVNANKCTQLNIKLSGALGKRTHFQQNAKSILFLNLTRETLENQPSNDDDLTKLNKNQVDIPKDMNLVDDTLLTKPVFLNDLNQEKVELSDDEETLLLAIVKFGSKCGVKEDNLLKEELVTYLEHLISKSTVWSVIYESMYQRSIFESNERRKVERSMLQLSELVDKINNNVLTPEHTKLHLFYSSLITPIWRIKRKLADVLISLGCVKEALNIYIELDLWEEIVFCYKQIGRRDKAAEIIRTQLEIKETPYLLCLLGDATDQIECYENAWKLSNGKSYLAQKRLGYHYFGLEDYKKAIECFLKSIEINPMQLDALQRLGYAALLVEDYELAANSYRRVVESDLDNFQAWNNLSKAYIKMKDKMRAYRTLQEALKNNYENWKIWENFIVVCVDVGAFNDVINSFNRLIDIKSKYEDDEIMEILINQLCTNDNQELNIPNLQKRTLKLLGRMTSNFQCSSTLWLLYAKLLLHLGSKENEEKIVNCLTKAQRALISKPGWDKNKDEIVNNLKSLNLTYDYYKQVLEHIEDAETIRRHTASFKLSANSMITLIKTRSEYWSIDEQTRLDVQKSLDEITDKLSEL